MGTPEKDYDDDQLVLDIAAGRMSYAEIGQKHGLAEVTISQIARGLRRPELRPRIEAAVQGFVDEAKRVAVRHARSALGRLVKLIGQSSDAPADVQRKASVDILKFSLGDPGRPEVNVSNSNTNRGSLPVADEDAQAFYEFKASRHGGPDDEEGT